MHAGMPDVRESFGAEIVAQIKRNRLHFETVCDLLACGKGVDALAMCAPDNKDEAEKLCRRKGGE